MRGLQMGATLHSHLNNIRRIPFFKNLSALQEDRKKTYVVLGARCGTSLLVEPVPLRARINVVKRSWSENAQQAFKVVARSSSVPSRTSSVIPDGGRTPKLPDRNCDACC